MSVFEIKNDGFYFDGKPFRVFSGAMHYFRILPEYWLDRLKKLKACGLNTVETYIPWNFHEAKEGQFNFIGLADVEKYISLAESIGLKVILRPSPYICSEWDFGGLPAWLLANNNLTVRCACPYYLEKVENYYKELIPRLAKHQCTNGGGIIMIQIENEYGSYGNDKKYLRFLKDKMEKYGIDVPMFTADGATFTHLNGGTLPEVFKVANFGSNANGQLGVLKEFQPDKPLMCGEFWNGWFDHYGEKHHSTSVEVYEREFEQLISIGDFNLYMFHGGTTFGWMAGANHGGKYEPDVSSYDYDAPLDEAGNITEKYRMTQKLIRKYAGDFETEDFPITKAKAYGKIHFGEQAYLFDNLDGISVKRHTSSPLNMERYGQNYGFIMYRTTVPHYDKATLEISRPHDKAHIFVNGQRQAMIYRNDENKTVNVSFPKEENVLEIFVDVLGRVNFGHELHDRKGLDCPVILNGFQELFGWDVFCMEMEDISCVKYEKSEKNISGSPAFLRSNFTINGKPEDTYLRLDDFIRGQIWVNGFNLSRYWTTEGPQKTYYIPAALLKSGENEIVVFEIEGTTSLDGVLTDKSDLG